jgi:hypothetical protein
MAGQDWALLAGSLALLGALAAVMFITRRVDWYGPRTPDAPLDRLPDPPAGSFADAGAYTRPLP